MQLNYDTPEKAAALSIIFGEAVMATDRVYELFHTQQTNIPEMKDYILFLLHRRAMIFKYLEQEDPNAHVNQSIIDKLTGVSTNENPAIA